MSNAGSSSTYGLDPGLMAELKRIELRSRRRIDADLMGGYRSAFRGSGLVFSDLREYQPGDETKNINWKVSARTGKVYVKSYEEERLLNVILAVDISASTLFGSSRTKHRRALEFAALLSLLASKNRDALGLCMFGRQVESYLPPRQNRSQLFRVLYALLAERELSRGTDIAAALTHLLSNQKRRAVLFIVSDFIAPPFEKELQGLAHRHDVILVQLSDPLDYEMPAAGLVEFEDAETGDRCTIDSSSRRGREQLRVLADTRESRLVESARRCGCDHIKIDDSPLRPLAALMRTRTRRVR